MSFTNYEVIERFAKGKQTGRYGNVYYRGDILYSYGEHFPLAVKHKWGKRIQYVINADRYSPTTSQHQNLAIRALKSNVQIPFSALGGAHIYPTSKDFVIVDYRSDSTYETCKTCGKDVKSTYSSDNFRWDVYHIADKTPICSFEGKTESDCIKYEHVLGAVLLRKGRRYYLSSIDDNEPWRYRSYFLCQLPHKVKTISEAYESLKPKILNEFRKGLEIKRQGDIFAVPTNFSLKELKTRDKKFSHLKHCLGNISSSYLLKSSHVATEMIRINGWVYARGCLYHRPPFGRFPQHARVKLGKQWHLIVKNLAKASWSAQGRVD